MTISPVGDIISIGGDNHMVNKTAIDIYLASKNKNYVWLARESGISYKALNEIVNGKKNPLLSSIVAIHRATKLSFNEIIKAA